MPKWPAEASREAGREAGKETCQIAHPKSKVSQLPPRSPQILLKFP